MSARLGLGLAALGRPGYLNLGHGADLGADRSVDALRARAHEVLDAAYAAGVRDFDAARSYGRGGGVPRRVAARRARPRDVRVSSKWGYVYTAGWEIATDPPEVKHHDLDTFRRQLEETRAHLGDWLDLYQIHSATPDSGVLENEPVLAAMRETGVPLGVTVSGAEPGRRRSTARVALGHLQRRPGDLEPARARGRAGAASARTRPG